MDGYLSKPIDRVALFEAVEGAAASGGTDSTATGNGDAVIARSSTVSG